MESGGGSAAAVKVGSSSSAMAAPVVEEEAMWQLNLRGNEAMESVPYPERPGVPDCAYYIRTGLCRFGMTCKFNHPPNRNLAAAIIRMKELYPERVGQPECQYYLKTGTCKFGSTCKFHHPKDKAGVAGRVQLNMLGYPLRPHETECAYYLRTGMCKFGSTCKFDHPQPSNAMVSLRGSLVYPTVHSPSTPGQQSYPGGLTNWPLSRASLIPSPRWQGTSSYTQGVLPQGLVQVPGWSPYPGQLSALSSPESLQQSPGMSQFYSTSRQSEAATLGSPEAFSSYRVMSNTPVGIYALQRENIFPERPDQPECQFYMKTGDCKFGATCKFHHPRERSLPIPNCMLSPLGLPIRPGEPLCIFYSRYGICKFGPNCKFNHPMGNFAYTTSTSATVDAQADRRMLASSSGSALTSPTEGPSDHSDPSSSRRHSVSSSHQMTSGVNNLKIGGSHTTSSNLQVSSFS